MLGADEDIDLGFALGMFGGGRCRWLYQGIEDGAADLACCSEDGVGGHCALGVVVSVDVSEVDGGDGAEVFWTLISQVRYVDGILLFFHAFEVRCL